jgi:aspartate-semialdehyde dehydrogenase
MVGVAGCWLAVKWLPRFALPCAVLGALLDVLPVHIHSVSPRTAAGKPITTNIFPFQYAFNLFSHNSPMTDNGYNEEEMKLVSS